IVITLILAVIFLVFKINEFSGFLSDGYGISTSSFLSSYYVLVGLHAAHVLFGCGWMIILLIQLKGIHIPYHLFVEKFKIFSYYWHFVDIVWIFIILLVYVKYLIYKVLFIVVGYHNDRKRLIDKPPCSLYP